MSVGVCGMEGDWLLVVDATYEGGTPYVLLIISKLGAPGRILTTAAPWEMISNQEEVEITECNAS